MSTRTAPCLRVSSAARASMSRLTDSSNCCLRQDAGAEEDVAEGLVPVARRGEDHVAVPDVDLLLDLAAAHDQHPGHPVVMHRLEDLGKRGFREVAAELEAAVRHRAHCTEIRTRPGCYHRGP